MKTSRKSARDANFSLPLKPFLAFVPPALSIIAFI